MVVQVNGKLRAKLQVKRDEDKEVLKEAIYDLEAVQRHLEGMKVIKEIVVKNRLVNLVVKPK